MNIHDCHRELLSGIRQLLDSYSFAWVTWLSPPCTGGSPAQHLSPGAEDRISRKFQEFSKILEVTNKLLGQADYRMLELSKHCVFWKSSLVRELIHKVEITSTNYYDRCSYDDGPLPRAKHAYRVQSSVPLDPKRRCSCDQRTPLNDQNLSALGRYPRDMTSEVIDRISHATGSHLGVSLH